MRLEDEVDQRLPVLLVLVDYEWQDEEAALYHGYTVYSQPRIQDEFRDQTVDNPDNRDPYTLALRCCRYLFSH